MIVNRNATENVEGAKKISKSKKTGYKIATKKEVRNKLVGLNKQKIR